MYAMQWMSNQRARWIPLLVLPICLVGRAGQVLAVSDRAAAVVVYPYVAVDSANGIDTELRLSNASSTAINVYCVYENATRFCTTTGQPCTTDAGCSLPGEACETGCQPTDFEVRLTPQQPIGWLAGTGLLTLPCETPGECPEQSGGAVPPVSTDPFVGSLRCVAVDTNRVPLERNDLEGAATVERFQVGVTDRFDIGKYNAVGLAAVAGAQNGDNELLFGDEYESCPAVGLVDSFLHGGVEPSAGQDSIEPGLVLLPCSADFESLMKTTTAVHVDVFNEFAQRLGTGRRLHCQFAGPLTAIHPVIFDVGVHGTLTGKILVRSIESGLVVLGLERHRDIADPSLSSSAASNGHGRGIRSTSDSIRLPMLP